MASPLSRSESVVLGLIARYGPLTPYELKARAGESVGHFWPIPHAQLYRDPPRLAERGLLSERQEEHGRRRRVFALTPQGEQALKDWLAEPDTPEPETRDPALLKLAFADLGSPQDLTALAAEQVRRHAGWRDTYLKRLVELDRDDPQALGRERVLRLGVGHEQAYIDYWETLL